MASKKLPARRQRPAYDDSLLIRTAESLGRMIGTLQRQLDAARLLTGKMQTQRGGADEQFESGNGSGHPARRKARSAKSSRPRSEGAKRASASGRKSKSAVSIGARQKRSRKKTTSRHT